MDTKFGKTFAKQLGIFYTCATDNMKYNKFNIGINIIGKNTESQIYAQMCKNSFINKIIESEFIIIKKLLYKLDITLDTSIVIRHY